MSLNLTTCVFRAEGLMTAPVDKDIVILNMASNNYVSLDMIGRRIWEQLEKPIIVGELCRQLQQEFAGEEEQIVADVLSFLTELDKEGLLRVADK